MSRRLHREGRTEVQRRRDGGEPEIAQQTTQTAGGSGQPAIVPQAGRGTDGQPRLLRIDLPGMEIKHDGLALEAVHAANAPARPRVWQQAEVPAAGNRQVDPAQAYRRRRNLDERT